MTAYFGFENLIPLASISAPESLGYEKENAYDWFTYTWWLSPTSDSVTYEIDFDTPQSIDYFGIASHNIDSLLGDARCRLEFYDGGSWQTFNNTIIQPTDNSPIFVKADNVAISTIWRFIFDNYVGISPYIGVLSMGKALKLPVGIQAPFTPPPYFFDNKIFNSESSKGQFLGRSVEKYALKCLIKQKNLDPQWMLDNWATVIKYLENQSFFYTWNHEDYPQDAIYGWLDGDLPVAKFTDPTYAGFDIKCKALHKSDWF